MGNLVLKNKILALKKQIQQLKASVFLVTAMLFSNSVMAIDIAQSPLFIDRSATPNIMFVLDDSGSMDFDILTVPHWRAQNYDHDVMRYWAQGGWLGWSDTPTGKITDATWRSYTGYCNDRNADGICYNELYLNDDNDRNDNEKTFIAPVVANDDWGLVLQHWYFWEFPKGYCQMPGGGPALPDAGDWLPSLDKVFAFLTGSKQAYAHSGDFGPGSPHQWNGANHPSAQNTGGAGAYRQEVWTNKGPERNTWDVDNEYYNNAAPKTTCEGNGGTWKRTTNYNHRVLHHGSYTFDGVTTNAGWVNGWSGPAPVINALTGAITANGPLNSNTGDYHHEYLRNYTTATGGRARFDINGDGVGNDRSFREKDGQSNRVVNYRYIQHLTDNTYPRADWHACGNTSNTNYWMATNACAPLNSTMPGNYPVASPNSPIDNPSNRVAQSIYNKGKTDFVQLGNPAIVPRYIRSLDWVGSPRTPNSDVLMPPWAAGTKHAMSKHDPFPLVVDWRVRSADFNVMYYRPSSNYEVWADITEVLPSGCSNKFNCARSNPQPGTAGYSLTEDLARPRAEYGAAGVAPVNVQAGFVYEVWVDDAGHMPSRSRPEWIRGDSKCGTTGGYTITPADVAASAGGAGIVDPATGITYGAGEHVCFSYLNLDPSGNAGDGEIDLWDSHYRVEVRDSDILVQKVRRTPHLKGEALYTDSVYDRSSHYYWDSNDVAGLPSNGSVSISNADLANMRVAMSDTRVLDTWDTAAIYADLALCKKLLGEDPANPGSCRTLAQVKENAANWYQYSRKRSFVAKGAIGLLMAEIPDVNYGLMGTKKHSSDNISSLFRDVYDGKGSGNGDADRNTHNDNIRSALYSYVWPATGTPLRRALERAGEYFAGRGPNLGAGVNNHSISPIIESCQKNYAIMLTDGYWNGSDPIGVTNEDGDAFGAAYNGTLADVAKKYYDEDLRPLMPNEVPTDAFDTNSQQHLTTIGIGFGVSGSLVDDPDPLTAPAEDGWPGNPDASGASILTETSTWGGDPKPNSNAAFKIDDLWHAAYNSRGRYYKADNPDELILQLKAAILTALAASGSASALTANSAVLTGTTRVYQTLFKSDEWSGEVKAYSLTASGLINPEPIWTAESQIASPGDRKIFTLDASGAGASFSWAALSPSQQLMLRTRWVPNVLENVAFGKAQLNYIRGQSDAQFRTRAHKLGDIVHSEPLYVGGPNQLYPDSWHVLDYSDFRSDNSGRTPMLYVGANDGMMHAFDATTGAEKYAYIPSVLLPDLNALSHKPSPGQDFVHRYYVDDTPVSGDVFFSGAWHTVLVGGLRAGGKGIYALDITTVPEDMDAETTIAGNKALWEFTTSNDVDMGYSFSRPSIVKLNNGDWGAVFGNGYNSANQKAVLYIVNVADGSLIKKFEMGIGSGANSNGLSTPTLVDTNGDMIADRVYAGDLLGNVWTIDISANNEANWKFSYDTLAVSNTAVAKTPLFTASDGSGGVQPITAPITLSRHPYGPLAGYLLNFGTGKYVGSTDNTDTGQVTQTMYGIWDYGVAGVTRGDLLLQIIESDLSHAGSGTEVRVTSANGPVNWLNAGHNVGDVGWETQVNQKGWRMDLIDTGAGTPANHGERIVSKMIIIDGAIIFSTLLPAADPCDGGGSGYTMALNAATGARFAVSPFDIDGDGLFSTADYADVDADGSAESAVSGVKSSSGIPSVPLMLYKPGGGVVAISDHSSGGLSFSGSSAAGSASCTVVGTGTCTIIPPANPGDLPTCSVSDVGSACYIGGTCAGGLCPVNGFNTVGRQSWIQIE